MGSFKLDIGNTAVKKTAVVGSERIGFGTLVMQLPVQVGLQVIWKNKTVHVQQEQKV